MGLSPPLFQGKKGRTDRGRWGKRTGRCHVKEVKMCLAGSSREKWARGISFAFIHFIRLMLNLKHFEG